MEEVEEHSTVEPAPATAPGPVNGSKVELNAGPTVPQQTKLLREDARAEIMQPENGTRNTPSVSAALAAANAAGSGSRMNFPADDGGRSLAEMAHRDLDAALQLLADRAQYITGANGAAIALRRGGKNDMLCRASTGPNAPELGALLSTEFGLSGESVRTRRPLRCDDAERDARVNREVCRQLGIASVVVMPVVNDDEVLGVFELFSGKANAFGERDLSALQRLSEMVETAVKLARAAESVPQRLKADVVSVAERADEEILDPENVAPQSFAPETLASQAAEFLSDEDLDAEIVDAAPSVEVVELRALEVTNKVAPEAAPITSSKSVPEVSAASAPQITPKPKVSEPMKPEAPKKVLFWTAPLRPVEDADKFAEADQSHVPPVLRDLRKCQACGFPVSAGRLLCVECEEKKWRGQLRPQASRQTASAGAVGAKLAAVPTVAATSNAPLAANSATPAPRAFAAAAQAAPSIPPAIPRKSPQSASVSNAAVPAILPNGTENKVVASASTPEVKEEPKPNAGEAGSPMPMFSAGLPSSQSWLSANKYVLGALLVVAAVVAGVFLLR